MVHRRAGCGHSGLCKVEPWAVVCCTGVRDGGRIQTGSAPQSREHGRVKGSRHSFQLALCSCGLIRPKILTESRPRGQCKPMKMATTRNVESSMEPDATQLVMRADCEPHAELGSLREDMAPAVCSVTGWGGRGRADTCKIRGAVRERGGEGWGDLLQAEGTAV